MNLLISHSQLQLRARGFDAAACRWGPRNLQQGAILHRDYVVFDPLPEDAFGAHVHVTLAAAFAPDPGAQRCMQVPFRVGVGDAVQVASAAEAFDVTLALQAGDYAVYTRSAKATRCITDSPWCRRRSQWRHAICWTIRGVGRRLRRYTKEWYRRQRGGRWRNTKKACGAAIGARRQRQMQPRPRAVGVAASGRHRAACGREAAGGASGGDDLDPSMRVSRHDDLQPCRSALLRRPW